VIVPTADGVTVAVRVLPRARKSQIDGERGGALVVRIAAPPVEGAANDALIELFASALDIPRRSIQIVSGHHGRQKQVAIAGVTVDDIRALTLG